VDVATDTVPGATPSRRRVRRAAGLLVRLLLSAGLLAWVLSRLHWSELAHVWTGVRPIWVLAALGLYAAAQVLSSCRWQILARSLGFRVHLLEYVRLYYVGMFFNLFLPTSMGGDVVRAWYLARRGPAGSQWRAMLSVLGERCSGLLVLLALGCVATLTAPVGISRRVCYALWIVALGAGTAVALLPAAARFFAWLRPLAESLSLSRAKQGRWWLALGLSFVIQLASIVEIAMLGTALSIPVPWWAYGVVVPLVTLLTLLPVSMNGVGVREGSLMVLLGPLGGSAAQAVALGILWLAVHALASLAGGVLWLLPMVAGTDPWPSASAREGDPTHGSVRCHSHTGRERQPASATPATS